MLDTIKSLFTSKRMGVVLVTGLVYLGLHFGVTISPEDKAAMEQGIPALVGTIGLIITKIIDSRKK